MTDQDLINVYEVHGGNARGRGWDFLVCTSMKDALCTIESDLDALEDGEELKIIFKRYTKAQMDEVVYE
jgi:hypothetical protein